MKAGDTAHIHFLVGGKWAPGGIGVLLMATGNSLECMTVGEKEIPGPFYAWSVGGQYGSESVCWVRESDILPNGPEEAGRDGSGMKSGDRLTIHHLGAASLIREGEPGHLHAKLPGSPPEIFDPEDGKAIPGTFERWIVVEDSGEVLATWVHEDHLIEAGPPTLLSDGVIPIPKILRIGDVIQVVSDVYHTTPEALSARSRASEHLIPRQVAMTLARRYTTASIAMIAACFARDHPSVANAVRKLQETEDAELLHQIASVEAKLDAVVRGRLAAADDRPPEIRALYHLFEAAKLLRADGQVGVSHDALNLAQRIAGSTPGSTQWCRDAQAWIDSLGEEKKTP